MDTVHSIATLYRISPFDVLEDDIEHFIMVVNYLIEKGDNGGGSKVHKTGRDPMWDML